MNIMKKKTAVLIICLGFLSGSVYSVSARAFDTSKQGTQNNSPNETNAEIARLLAHKSYDHHAHLKKDSSNQNQATASQVPEHNEDALNSTSNEAFARTVRSLMPMSPEQIKTLRYMLDQSQRAAATFPGTPPRPTSSSVIVRLAPGATPPIIRLRAGFVTSLDFLDSTGASWPIAAYDLGDPKSFNIQWDRKGNTLLVQSTTTYKDGNLAVLLKGLDTPVMLTLMPGQSNVDYRVDLRIPGLGPYAKTGINGLPARSNPELIDFLDGVAPKNAHALVISGDGNQSQAWLYGNKLYLRTRATLLSPSWLSSISSSDGTHVYELPKAPVILASEQGSMIQLMIKGL